MRVAITGGTGFVGRHLAALYGPQETIQLSRRTGQSLDDVAALTAAFQGCEVVVHAAGINREIGDQTFQRVHVDGTANVLEAAKHAGVRKVVFMSFIRARPNCNSPYHESKWAAEELVRASGLDYTIVKAGMTYGRGDHMLDHLSHTAYTIPFLPVVGFHDQLVAPLPVEDLSRILKAAADGEMPRATVVAIGAETLTFRRITKRVAATVHRPMFVFALPVWLHRLLANIWEATMVVPLVAKAQVRMLSEDMTVPLPFADEVPEHVRPRLKLTRAQIKAGLPEPGPFTAHDLRLFNRGNG